MLKAIVNVEQSYYFDTADVVVTDCGHRHVRPKSLGYAVGGDLNCPFCDDDALDTGLTTRQLFRQWRAFDYNWQKGVIMHAIETANRIHAQHNPFLIPVGYNAFATRYEIRDAAQQLADTIDRQCFERLMVEASEHWPNLPTPRIIKG